MFTTGVVTTEKPTLRARRREQMLIDIRAAARRQLLAEGAAALSLRAVARDLGIAVSALYRYFDGRDALLTDLIVAAFTAHAEAVEAATATADGDDVRAVLRAGFLAYRDWGLAHPADFALVYGAPVPGYRAPAARTTQPGTRITDHLTELAVQAWEQGLFDEATLRNRAARLNPDTERELARLCRERGYRLPVPAFALAYDCFVAVHGAVAMEVFDQLRPVLPDAAPYVTDLLDTHLDAMVGPARERGA